MWFLPLVVTWIHVSCLTWQQARHWLPVILQWPLYTCVRPKIVLDNVTHFTGIKVGRASDILLSSMKSHRPTAALTFALAGAVTLMVIRYTTCEVDASIRSTRGHHHHSLGLGFAVAPCHSIAVPKQRVQQGDRWVSTGSRLWLTRPPPPQSEAELSPIRDAHRGRRRKTPYRSTGTPRDFRYGALHSVESGDADATGVAPHDACRESKVAVPGPAEQERWIRRMDMAVSLKSNDQSVLLYCSSSPPTNRILYFCPLLETWGRKIAAFLFIFVGAISLDRSDRCDIALRAVMYS